MSNDHIFILPFCQSAVGRCLYQMNGNAFDLVYDCYDEGRAYTETVVVPIGIKIAVKKVVRGGNRRNSLMGNTNFSRHCTNSDANAYPL